MDADTQTKKPSFIEETLRRTAPRHEPEVEDSLKESRPAVPTPMLDVAFRDGKVRSFSYAYLAEVEYEPGDMLTVKYSTGAAIIIEGRGLAKHRQQIRLHRADEIRECTESERMLQAESESQIERIHIVEGEKL